MQYFVSLSWSETAKLPFPRPFSSCWLKTKAKLWAEEKVKKKVINLEVFIFSTACEPLWAFFVVHKTNKRSFHAHLGPATEAPLSPWLLFPSLKRLCFHVLILTSGIARWQGKRLEASVTLEVEMENRKLCWSVNDLARLQIRWRRVRRSSFDYPASVLNFVRLATKKTLDDTPDSTGN